MKKVLSDISLLVPYTPHYENVKSKLDFSDFKSGAIRMIPRKTALRIIIPVSAVCLIGVAFAIIIPTLSKNDQVVSQPNKLVVLNDKALLSTVSGLTNASEQSPMATPSLDKVWEDYLDYTNKNAQGDAFLYESKLESSSFYNCYYLSKETISKIDAFSEKEYMYYMYDEIGNLNYLRYYQKLLDEEKLDASDKVMLLNAEIEAPSIEKEIDGYLLVKMSRSIDIENKALGNLFVENVNYKEEGNSIIPLINSSFDSNRYNHTKIIFNNVPYMKSLFKEGIYSSAFLDVFSYQINEENGTFVTGMKYDCSILESDEHFYDDINDIIIEKEFITKSTIMTSDNIEKSYDYYNVTCDYNKAKLLFNL